MLLCKLKGTDSRQEKQGTLQVFIGDDKVEALAQHAGGIEDGTVFGGKEFGALEHNGGAGGPRGLRPDLMGLHGGVNCHLDFLLPYLVEGCKHVAVLMGAYYLTRVAGADFLTADDDGDVHHRVVLALELCVQGDALRGAFKIGLHRFVGRYGEVDDCVVHIVKIKLIFHKILHICSGKTAYKNYRRRTGFRNQVQKWMIGIEHF